MVCRPGISTSFGQLDQHVPVCITQTFRYHMEHWKKKRKAGDHKERKTSNWLPLSYCLLGEAWACNPKWARKGIPVSVGRCLQTGSYPWDYLDQLWKEPYGDDSANMIWWFVRRLRKKMEKTEPEAAKIIQSIRKVGYYLDIDRHWAKCRKMSNYAKSDWQMTVTLHSSDSLFLYTSFCGVLVRHDKEKSYICINGSP